MHLVTNPKFAKKHEERLHRQENAEIIQLLDIVDTVGGSKEETFKQCDSCARQYSRAVLYNLHYKRVYKFTTETFGC